MYRNQYSQQTHLLVINIKQLVSIHTRRMFLVVGLCYIAREMVENIQRCGITCILLWVRSRIRYLKYHKMNHIFIHIIGVVMFQRPFLTNLDRSCNGFLTQVYYTMLRKREIKLDYWTWQWICVTSNLCSFNYFEQCVKSIICTGQAALRQSGSDLWLDDWRNHD